MFNDYYYYYYYYYKWGIIREHLLPHRLLWPQLWNDCKRSPLPMVPWLMVLAAWNRFLQVLYCLLDLDPWVARIEVNRPWTKIPYLISSLDIPESSHIGYQPITSHKFQILVVNRSIFPSHEWWEWDKLNELEIKWHKWERPGGLGQLWVEENSGNSIIRENSNNPESILRHRGSDPELKSR